jgi:hypothetical protein
VSTMPYATRNGTPTKTGLSILDWISRHGFGTNEQIQRAVAPDESIERVRSFTYSLVISHYLRSRRFRGKEQIYSLAQRGYRALGLPIPRRTRVDDSKLTRAFLIAEFCLTYGAHRLRGVELLQDHAWLPEEDVHQATYLSFQERLCLMLFPRAEPNRTADKVQLQLEKRLMRPEFKRLIEEGRYGVIVPAATETQALSIRQALIARPWPNDVKIFVRVTPGFELMAASNV